jgi:hypothetical protein
LKKFLVGLLADLVADRDFVILAFMQALAVTWVMKPLNLVLKSPGEKPTKNFFNSALTQQVAAVSLMNMPILVWSFAKTSLKRRARAIRAPHRRRRRRFSPPVTPRKTKIAGRLSRKYRHALKELAK